MRINQKRVVEGMSCPLVIAYLHAWLMAETMSSIAAVNADSAESNKSSGGTINTGTGKGRQFHCIISPWAIPHCFGSPYVVRLGLEELGIFEPRVKVVVILQYFIHVKIVKFNYLLRGKRISASSLSSLLFSISPQPSISCLIVFSSLAFQA